jgi:hypothetical protein
MTMHDDAFDELASAYLDDEVGIDERARVEADTDLLGRVEEFRGLRTSMLSSFAVGDVDDDLLGAALGAFDDEQATTTFAPPVADTTADTSLNAPHSTIAAPTAPVVRSLDEARRQRTRKVYGWIGAAAAAGVIAVGVTSLSGTNNAAQDAASKSPESVAAPAAESGQANDELVLPEVAPAASAAPAADAAPAESTAATVGSIEGPASASTDTDAVATEAPVASAAPAAEPPAPVDGSGIVDIGSQEELASQAQFVIAGGASNARTTSLISCPELGAEAVSEILWQGRQAFVLLRPSAANPREAIAVSNNCEILATIAL